LKSLTPKLSLPLAGLAVTAALAACSPQKAADAPLAGAWTVDSGASHVSFATVKSGTIAESHVFKSVTGGVAADGKAKFEIDLASAATGIDIRDERLRTLLFEVGAYPKATVTAQLDPAAFKALAVGQSLAVTVPAKLDLHGIQGDVEAPLTVTRAGPDRVVVSTVKPIIVDGDDFGLEAGIEKLREVANLPAITHSTPVSLSITLKK